MKPYTVPFQFLALMFLVLALAGVSAARAEVRMPKVFGSHMVLQQGKPLPIWGWAQPQEKVKVQIAGITQETQANEKGEWKVVLPAMPAGGPFAMVVSGSDAITFEDVMIGEVWLCSGQSNMEMGIGQAANGAAEIAAANHPGLRLLVVPKRLAPQPEADMEGTWKVCTPQSAAEGPWNGFSACGYYFGRTLNQQLGVTVGLIDASWGGTCIDTWTPPVGFAAVPALRDENERVQLADPYSPLHQQRAGEACQTIEQWLGAAKAAVAAEKPVPSLPGFPEELLSPHNEQNPTALFNGMIFPVCPFAMRGAIWYQGEANMGQGMLYTEKMKALVGGWRQLWQEGDFPFYFVQIAPYNYGDNPATEAELWEAQAAAPTAIPNTGMTVVNDIGNLNDIHPTNKQEVGRRLSLWALAHTYGRSNVVCSGPVFKSMTVEGDKIRLAFDQVAGGLSSRDGKPLSWFEMIDSDEGGFVPADAQVDGATIVLSSPQIKHPAAMRFAWSMLAEPNLMNSAGLPAGAFRDGTIPQRDQLALGLPAAENYQVVYDLDLGALGHTIKYQVDNRAGITRPFDRVAYLLELQKADGDSEYVFASMDAFTTDLGKIGVPTVDSQAHFQQNVSNLSVRSNVKGIVTGDNLAGGNIEFWPNNYGPGNSAGVPGASSVVFDFGDQPTDPLDGYGCMQVHNHDARQTLFALNHWSEGAKADVGIGNSTGANPDWTFAANAHSYVSKRLRVLVRCK
jgi:sialate O-acetylesterase